MIFNCASPVVATGAALEDAVAGASIAAKHRAKMNRTIWVSYVLYFVICLICRNWALEYLPSLSLFVRCGKRSPPGMFAAFGYRSASILSFLGQAEVIVLLAEMIAMERRTFIKTGLVGGALLVGAGWASKGTFWGAGSKRVRRAGEDFGFLTEADYAALSAIIPVMLTGCLDRAEGDREALLAETIKNFDGAVSSFLPEVQKELRQLFSLLSLAPARYFMVGVRSSWQEAKPQTVDAFLRTWQMSDKALFRTAYDALQQLTMGSWYSVSESWRQIGYPGPPPIGQA